MCNIIFGYIYVNIFRLIRLRIEMRSRKTHQIHMFFLFILFVNLRQMISWYWYEAYNFFHQDNSISSNVISISFFVRYRIRFRLEYDEWRKREDFKISQKFEFIHRALILLFCHVWKSRYRRRSMICMEFTCHVRKNIVISIVILWSSRFRLTILVWNRLYRVARDCTCHIPMSESRDVFQFVRIIMIIRSKKTKRLNESCVDDIVNYVLWQNDTFYRVFDSTQERQYQLRKNDYMESCLRVFLDNSVEERLR